MPIITEYKDNKLICLNPEEKYPFSFGLNKAKIILANIGAIETFVATNGERCDSDLDPSRVADAPPEIGNGGEELPF